MGRRSLKFGKDSVVFSSGGRRPFGRAPLSADGAEREDLRDGRRGFDGFGAVCSGVCGCGRGCFRFNGLLLSFWGVRFLLMIRSKSSFRCSK